MTSMLAVALVSALYFVPLVVVAVPRVRREARARRSSFDG